MKDLEKPSLEIENQFSTEYLFLESLRQSQIGVSIFLISGIRLRGFVDTFDEVMVVLKNEINLLIYKHAIASIFADASSHN